MTAHIRWLCGSTVIHGAQTTLRMVSSGDWWRTYKPPRLGSPSDRRTVVGSVTARATTSRTAGCADPSLSAVQQSETNWSRSNTLLLRSTRDELEPTE